MSSPISDSLLVDLRFEADLQDSATGLEVERASLLKLGDCTDCCDDSWPACRAAVGMYQIPVTLQQHDI